MIVYLPILALEGVEGKLFRPMALTVIFALVGSMVLSLTLMPVLASLLLPRADARARERRGARGSSASTGRCCDVALRCALGGARASPCSLLGNAAFLATRARLGVRARGSARAPIVINTVRLAGVSLDESVRYGTQIERRSCAKFPDEIERVWTPDRHGRGRHRPDGPRALRRVRHAQAARASGSAATTQDELVAEMQERLGDLPGMRDGRSRSRSRCASTRWSPASAPTSASSSSATTSTSCKAKAARDRGGARRRSPARPTSSPSRSPGSRCSQIEVDRDADRAPRHRRARGARRRRGARRHRGRRAAGGRAALPDRACASHDALPRRPEARRRASWSTAAERRARPARRSSPRIATRRGPVDDPARVGQAPDRRAGERARSRRRLLRRRGAGRDRARGRAAARLLRPLRRPVRAPRARAERG